MSEQLHIWWWCDWMTIPTSSGIVIGMSGSHDWLKLPQFQDKRSCIQKILKLLGSIVQTPIGGGRALVLKVKHRKWRANNLAVKIYGWLLDTTTLGLKSPGMAVQLFALVAWWSWNKESRKIDCSVMQKKLDEEPKKSNWLNWFQKI
jgi:hypothetical protein